MSDEIPERKKIIAEIVKFQTENETDDTRIDVLKQYLKEKKNQPIE